MSNLNWVCYLNLNRLIIYRDESLDIEDTHIINVLKFSNPSLNNLQQLIEGDPLFLWVFPKLKEDYVQPDWMDKLISELEHTEFTKPTLVKMMKDFAKNEGIKFIQLMKTLRVLLSSQKDGYQVAEMMEILGKESTKRRLARGNLTDRNSKVKNANWKYVEYIYLIELSLKMVL